MQVDASAGVHLIDPPPSACPAIAAGHQCPAPPPHTHPYTCVAHPSPQGDGTAAIFSGRRDVLTLSVHAAANFPARKQASHLDIGLPDGTGDQQYLR
jgi:hypothetical protein